MTVSVHLMCENVNNHKLESPCPSLFCAPQLVAFFLCTSSVRSYLLRVSESVLPSVLLRGKLWKISDLLSRLDCRTWTGPNSSLQTLFLVSVLPDLRFRAKETLQEWGHVCVCACSCLGSFCGRASCFSCVRFLRAAIVKPQLLNRQKLIWNYFEDPFSHFSGKNTEQSLGTASLLWGFATFSVLYHCKPNIFEFQIVVQT